MLRVSHWRPDATNERVDCVFDTHPELERRLAAVIVPGSWQGEPGDEVRNCLVSWLMHRHKTGSILCSVCGGAFVLAETGLLAGRTATTHWTFWDALARRFPDVHVDRNRIID